MEMFRRVFYIIIFIVLAGCDVCGSDKKRFDYQLNLISFDASDPFKPNPSCSTGGAGGTRPCCEYETELLNTYAYRSCGIRPGTALPTDANYASNIGGLGGMGVDSSYQQGTPTPNQIRFTSTGWTHTGAQNGGNPDGLIGGEIFITKNVSGVIQTLGPRGIEPDLSGLGLGTLMGDSTFSIASPNSVKAQEPLHIIECNTSGCAQAIYKVSIFPDQPIQPPGDTYTVDVCPSRITMHLLLERL